MAQDVFADEEGYTTRWDDDIEAVVHIWNKYVNGEMFRQGADAMLEAAEEYDGSKILIDHRDMTVVDREDQEYILEEWQPRAVDMGADTHVVVHEESTIAEMNLENVIDVDDSGVTSNMMSDIDEAREWLAEQ